LWKQNNRAGHELATLAHAETLTFVVRRLGNESKGEWAAAVGFLTKWDTQTGSGQVFAAAALRPRTAGSRRLLCLPYTANTCLREYSVSVTLTVGSRYGIVLNRRMSLLGVTGLLYTADHRSADRSP
jgi:hypothetical protein